MNYKFFLPVIIGLFLLAILFQSGIVSALPFSASWNTSKVTNSTNITLPITGIYQVDWGDGTINTSVAYHNYSAAGLYRINITNIAITNFGFNNAGDKLKIIDIYNWGDIYLGTIGGSFYGCSNLNSSNTIADNLNLTGITNLINMFNGASKFNGNISGWDVSKVTSINGMFKSASAFNQHLSNWDTSNITDMSYAFASASNFNGNISNWNTSSVTLMYQMFISASVFNQNLNSWDTSKVTTMAYLFSGTLAFNQNLTSWDTSKVTTMASMFQTALAFNGNISNWDTSKVTTMASMFYNAPKFNQALNSWNTSSVTTMASMFQYASGYPAMTFNQNLSNWDTSKVTSMATMFYNNPAFNQNIGFWNVSLVTTMAGMLNGTNLSVNNYDALLNGWAVLTLKNNTIFNAGNRNYSGSANISRAFIISNFNWTITDGELITPSGFLVYSEVLLPSAYPYIDVGQGFKLNYATYNETAIIYAGNLTLEFPNENISFKFPYNYTSQRYEINLLINETGNYPFLIYGNESILENYTGTLLVRTPYWITIEGYTDKELTTSYVNNLAYLTGEWNSNIRYNSFLYKYLGSTTRNPNVFHAIYSDGEAIIKLWETGTYDFRLIDGRMTFNGNYAPANITISYGTDIGIGRFEFATPINQTFAVYISDTDLHPWKWLFNALLIAGIVMAFAIGIMMLFIMPEVPWLALIFTILVVVFSVVLRAGVWLWKGW